MVMVLLVFKHVSEEEVKMNISVMYRVILFIQIILHQTFIYSFFNLEKKGRIQASAEDYVIHVVEIIPFFVCESNHKLLKH